MEREHGEGAWRDSMERERGTSYSIWPSPTAVTYVTYKCHIVTCSWTWPFFMSKVTKSEIALMHSTLCSTRTQCGVLFICRKLQNQKAHICTLQHIHYKYRNGNLGQCVRPHWPERT